MRASEILRRARRLIVDPRNWAKVGGIRTSQGRYCAVTALCMVLEKFTDDNEEFAAAREILRDAPVRAFRSRAPFSTIPEVNDHPDTTHADVLRLYDQAIVLAETDEKAEDVCAAETAGYYDN